MKLRHLAAACALAAVALVGTAGVASAQDATTTPSTAGTTKATLCAKATARLPKIQDRETKVETRINTLNSRLAKAQQGNHPDAVKVIQFRLDWAKTVDQHLKDTVSLINSECPTS